MRLRYFFNSVHRGGPFQNISKYDYCFCILFVGMRDPTRYHILKCTTAQEIWLVGSLLYVVSKAVNFECAQMWASKAF